VLLHLLSNPNTSTESISEESLNKAVELTRKSIDSVRMTSQELVPYFLINFGLSKTIQSIVDDANDISGLKVQFTKSIQWQIEDLPQELTIQLYRLLQEVYSNLLRHSKPTEIQIYLSTSDAGMQLLLTHNGVGLSQSEFEHLSKTGKSLGLQNIAYRKILIKASLTYQRMTPLSTIEIQIARQDLSFD
jgi:signal transduction histidine kinase